MDRLPGRQDARRPQRWGEVLGKDDDEEELGEKVEPCRTLRGNHVTSRKSTLMTRYHLHDKINT